MATEMNFTQAMRMVQAGGKVHRRKWYNPYNHVTIDRDAILAQDVFKQFYNSQYDNDLYVAPEDDYLATDWEAWTPPDAPAKPVDNTTTLGSMGGL